MSVPNPVADSLFTSLPKLVGLYTASGEARLEGDRRSLLEVAKMLTTGNASKRDLHVPNGTSPSPYDGFLTELQVTKEGDLVLIWIENKTLRISGSAARLMVLAENIEWLATKAEAESESPEHLHIEYHPDHFYLAPSSCPLVLGLKNPE